MPPKRKTPGAKPARSTSGKKVRRATAARAPARKPVRRAAPRRAAKTAERVRVSGLRTLGRETNAESAAAPAGGSRDERLAERARATLEEEFARVFALKDKIAAESRIGATEKGREAVGGRDKLRSLVASLEGMNRFALAMGLISAAESRELYAHAMKRGLYQGW